MKLSELGIGRSSGGLERKMKVLSWLNGELGKRFGRRTVLVGWTAAEIYAGWVFQGADINLIYAVDSDIDSVLLENGFRKAGKSWISDGLDIEINVPSARLDGSMGKLSTISFMGWKVYFIGIEDLIFDRLRAFCNWNDETSLEQAVFLLKSTKAAKEIDKPYLSSRINSERKSMVGKLSNLPEEKDVIKMLS